MPWWKISVFLLLGLVGLPLGADILVDASTTIARAFGGHRNRHRAHAGGPSAPRCRNSPRRSWPPCAGRPTSPSANVIGSKHVQRARHSSVSQGFFGTIPVEAQFLTFDLWVMLAASIVLAPFVLSKRLNMTRPWGLALIVAYAAYLWIVVHS